MLIFKYFIYKNFVKTKSHSEKYKIDLGKLICINLKILHNVFLTVKLTMKYYLQ